MKKALLISTLLLATPAHSAVISNDAMSCAIFSKRDIKIAARSSSTRLLGVWPTKKTPPFKKMLRKARSAFVCFGDTFCLLDTCITSSLGAYLDGGGRTIAKIEGSVLNDSEITCWVSTVGGIDASTVCQ